MDGEKHDASFYFGNNNSSDVKIEEHSSQLEDHEKSLRDSLKGVTDPYERYQIERREVQCNFPDDLFPGNTEEEQEQFFNDFYFKNTTCCDEELNTLQEWEAHYGSQHEGRKNCLYKMVGFRREDFEHTMSSSEANHSLEKLEKPRCPNRKIADQKLKKKISRKFSLASTIISSNIDVDVKNLRKRSGSEKKDRRTFKCNFDTCEKMFTSAYGLKYHLENGHNKKYDTEKKYACEISNCGRRYKNPNGLKYHKKHEHNISSGNSQNSSSTTTSSLFKQRRK